MKNIIYLCSNPTYSIKASSGYAVHIKELRDALSDQGYKVSICFPNDNQAEPKKRTNKYAFKRWVPKVIWETLKDIKRLLSDFLFYKRLIKNNTFDSVDIIYERLDYTGSFFSKKAKNLGIKYVVEVHAPYDEEQMEFKRFSLLSWLCHFRIKSALRHTKAIITVSTYMKEWLINKGAGAYKIHVLPNAVNKKLLLQKNNSRNEGDSIIGFVGSMAPWHRVDVLIEAFSRLKSKYSIKLFLVGNCDFDEKIKESIENLKLKNEITCTGAVSHEESIQYIRTFHIAIMPASNAYGSPIKIFEYGACKIPTIAPNTDPVKEVMINHKDGLIVESGNVAELEQAIEYLLNNPKEAKFFAKTFYEKISQKHTWDKNAEILKTVFES